jgi:hypothetical protein
MAAILVGQFHARDAAGRVYPVHEFQESTLDADGESLSAPIITYKLAIGDRVKHIEGDLFIVVQSNVEITREHESRPAKPAPAAE